MAPLHHKKLDPAKYLLAISQTCRRFRNISLSCTLLWARVHVEWPAKQRQLWVQRSGNRELDIVIYQALEYRVGWVADTPGDIFEKFQKWRTLSFTTRFAGVIEDVLRAVLPTVRCQSLQLIYIKSAPPYTAAPTEAEKPDERLWCRVRPTAEGSTFLNLRKITFWTAHGNPWGMLDAAVTIDAHSSHYSWKYWRQLLRRKTALKELFLGTEPQPRTMDDYGGAPLILSHLRSLQLRRYDPMLLKSFLSDVTAPSLGDLSIWLPSRHILANLTWEDITGALSGFVSFSNFPSQLRSRRSTLSCPGRHLYPS